MTSAESMKLLDAAMRSHDTEAYLRGVRDAFSEAGRDGDALVASVFRVLYMQGEIELLMIMRVSLAEGAKIYPG